MPDNMSKYDPWGPIASTLYLNNSSDLVENVMGLTGMSIQWPVLSDADRYAHINRIRAYKPAINAAYSALPDEEKGRVAQIVAKGLLNSSIKNETKHLLIDRLNDIGWTMTDDGSLTTQDALLSEQFFPPGTYYDAYTAIREILRKATNRILIVDAYMGSTLFATLSALNPKSLTVQLLTTARNLKPDFHVEAQKFRQQFPDVKLESRTTADFHDRFIAVDETEFYHVGASIKDAGSRAFLISRIQDAPVIKLLKEYVDEAWRSAAPVL
jgi:hypothetical protein